MSRETVEWLNRNTLQGFTDKRGRAWHFSAKAQGDESNHYPGAIPIDDVVRRLFYWEAISAPVSAAYITETGVTSVEDSQRQAIIRPDTATILGVFKSGYQIHQYREWLVDNVATILDDDLSIGSAGLLDGGGVAWVQVEIPDNISTPEGVEYRPNLLATTSLNGKVATTYKPTSTVVVCDNTLSIGLGEDGATYKVKHSRHSHLKIADARDALRLIYTASDEFAAEVRALCETSVSGLEFTRFIDAYNPIPDAPGRARTLAERKRDDLLRLWSSDERVAPWRGTAWGVLQMSNTYTQHLSSVRGNRLERNMLGAVTGTLWDSDRTAMSTLRKILAA